MTAVDAAAARSAAGEGTSGGEEGAGDCPAEAAGGGGAPAAAAAAAGKDPAADPDPATDPAADPDPAADSDLSLGLALMADPDSAADPGADSRVRVAAAVVAAVAAFGDSLG